MTRIYKVHLQNRNSTNYRETWVRDVKGHFTKETLSKNRGREVLSLLIRRCKWRPQWKTMLRTFNWKNFFFNICQHEALDKICIHRIILIVDKNGKKRKRFGKVWPYFRSSKSHALWPSNFTLRFTTKKNSLYLYQR